MASIMECLSKIKTAIYGKEVRQSIHDAILQCYQDATGNPESIAAQIRDIEQIKDDISKLNTDIEQIKKDIEALKNPTFEYNPDTGDLYYIISDTGGDNG